MEASNDEIEREMARDRGFLSAADRKWLLTPRDEYVEEHSRQYWGQRRDELRKRVYNAILDFTLLWEYWDVDEMWKLRGGWPERPNAPFTDEELQDGLRDMIALSLHLGRGDHLIKQLSGSSAAEELLILAFRRLGYWHTHHVSDIDITVNAEPIRYVDLIEDLKEGKDVPLERLVWALESGNLPVDLEPIQEMIQEEFRNQLSDAEKE